MVVLFLFGCERMVFAFLVRGLAVGMEFMHALVAGVGQQFKVRRKSQARAFEQGKVMGFADTCRHAQNLLRRMVNHDLSFLSVAFLLAGVVAALFFWVARRAAHWHPPQSP